MTSALGRGAVVAVAATVGMLGAELVALAQGHVSSTTSGRLAGILLVGVLLGCAAWRARDARRAPGAPHESLTVAELCADLGESAPLDATVLALGDALDRAGASTSAMPLAIHVGDELVEVFWDRPPPPVSSTFQRAPTGWVWTASPSLLVAHLKVGSDPSMPPLLPALVAAGVTGLGELHLNLEACRLINLVGDQPHVERALAHLMEALASPLVDVIAVGSRTTAEPPVAADVVSPEAAVTEVRRRRSRLRQQLEDRAWTSVIAARLRDPMAQQWRPLVVVVLDPGKDEGVLEPIVRAARGERSGVSCMFVNGAPDGESLAVACGPGVMHLPFLNGVAAVLPDRVEPPSVIAHDAFVPEELPAPEIDALVGTVEVRILGPVEIVGVSAPLGGKNTELVAYLACHPDGVSDERIKTVLWPKRPVTHQTWLNRVSACRHTLGAGPDGELVLPHFEEGIGRLAASVRTDVDALEVALYEARDMAEDNSLAVLRVALARVRGQPFEERSGYEWAFAEFHVAHAERIVTDVAHRLAEVALSVGDWKTARWAAEQGLAAVPASELLAQDRMRAFAASGDLRGVERALRDLLASLGTDDASSLQPDTLELYEQLCAPGRASSAWR